MLSSGQGVTARRGQDGEERRARSRQGFGAQEFLDGSKYEGEFVNGLKHGKGRYTWKNEEFYEGSFYKDYRHGDGMYCWRTGNKFIGKFYLNWREGYGKHIFPDGATFKGLYHADQRFGPGVLSEPSGCQDIGLWHGKHLIQMCNSVQGSFSLKNLTEYAAYLEQTTVSGSQSQIEKDDNLLLYDDFTILPSGIENYSKDGDHLPLPSGIRRDLDQHFFGQLCEPDSQPYEGHKRDPLSTLPLPAKMLLHIHKHRRQAETLDWDVAEVLSLKKDGFSPKGPLEVASELLIQQASRGERQAVLNILLDGLVHPDVADSQGHTALIAAVVNCHDDVIHLLLDMGANIDKVNCEGLSALSVCHVLYYPCQPFYFLSGPRTQTQDLMSYCGKPLQTSPQDFTTDSSSQNSRPQTNSTVLTNWDLTSDHVGAAEALSHTGLPQHSDTQETVRRMAAMKFEHRVRLNTMKLLLDRGADPNASIVPLPVLFLAIMAADTETVRRLLLCGAQTNVCLSSEKTGLYPLHVAAALPGPEGPKITELVLHALADPDARACDQTEICEPSKVSTMARKSWSTSEKPFPEEGGRTALHVACQRETDHSNASKVVSLLLSHKARTDLLWSGHSPLSLAIASGNDMAVEALLKEGADPNLPLGCGVGNALCFITNFFYHLDGKRTKLLDILEKSGADMLNPVHVGDCKGNVVDYAHHSFDQDLRIAHTPFHILNMEERETFKARRHLLSKMGHLLRGAAVQREKEQLEKEKELRLNCETALSRTDADASHKTKPPTAVKQRSPSWKFCYHCGRSAAVKLTACTHCHSVFYCSSACKRKAWDERHREECLQESASVDSFERMFLFQNQQDPTTVLKSIEIPTYSNVQLKIVGTEENQPLSLNENYSYN
ncbi:ankyrin repeat and MYND domain-containing protein 1-like [Vanacampus margaritifer]